ncbi:MAG: dipeptide ABC transporter ATP-binding protein [Gammaproteobacteria bacterium]|nr:dipeptide ABC transporter ATP-binding protein [Gammaproteobacteria bacterium]MCP4088740.1 dipeptide ABC transporter ATP-binding protein [Gammaproteobacteria bacterium]MCP4275217.1 dipeptide ABC transporter ATP-binding protein [Gammaproteobacteria bacterium]MCP4830773.1 dipeptide ABC transporter ATP-binding protein [Gammaproteobacteria bacterium]MCP4929562.1 dipeptide ABC transporter ATP-binding protein [Gammaproteobacteria bacterium]
MTPIDANLGFKQSQLTEDGSQPLLEVHELKKYFPLQGGLFGRPRQHLKAVDGVSFSLNRGRTLGLVGESGCGKSTLGRAILYLQPPSAGQVRLRGQPLSSLSNAGLMAARRDMQIIFQDPYASLSPRRTVAQIIREPLDVHRIGNSAERRERVEELLTIVGMRQNSLNRYPHEFSGGQRQRIGIARALALNPKFIVADEPVSALDVSVQSQVLNLIDRLKAEQNIAFLFISHDLAVIQHVSDDVAVMYLGKIVEQASARDIYAHPQHPYTRALLSAIPVPDPRHKAQRIALTGDVPSPLNPPAGCPFHARCPVVTELCRTDVPQLKPGKGEATHFVACHLVE